MKRLLAVLALGAGVLLVIPGHGSALPAGFAKVGMVCTPPTAGIYNLVARTGYIDTPDGNSVFMWSYANADAPDSGKFQSPGPVMCVNQGDTVTVHLTNNLPEPASVIFPGQQGVTASEGTAGLLAAEAPATGGTVTYTFTAAEPGTYLYESGSDPAKQVEMGLYGALVVRPNGHADWAYGNGSTQFDPTREYLLLLSELDPDLHHAVEVGAPYDINAKRDRYFAINGREFPDTVQDNGSGLLPNQPYGSLVRIQPTNYANSSSTLPALVRMLNAGLSNHPFHPHGNHTTEIAQDGRLLLSPGGQSAATEHFGEVVASGQTQDFLLRWDDQDKWSPTDPTHNLPVPPPNYRDVTFKGSNTWYSGSPYLGYKGTLPTGTTSQNICGEWYFPWHSHALNEFSNFDQGFGGMGTLLRVDPPGGCFATAGSTSLIGGTLKSGSPTALAANDASFYQVNPKTTTNSNALPNNAATTTMNVASSTGFPTAGLPANPFYVRIDNEVLRVNSAVGNAWNVTRAQLVTNTAAHLAGHTVTALGIDWYGTVANVPAGSANLRVTYAGENCGDTTSSTCASLTTNLPQQTVKICDWTISGATGCSTATSNGWVTLPAPQGIGVGSTNVTNTWAAPGTQSHFIGTGTYKGQVRVLIHNQRYTPSNPTPYSTWANQLALTYDAP